MRLLPIEDHAMIGMPVRQGPVKAGFAVDSVSDGRFASGRDHVAGAETGADEVAA